MSKYVRTIIEGTLALASLYVVGRLAFKAGYDVGRIETKVNEMQKESQVSNEPQKKEKRRIFDTLFKGKEIHVSVRPHKE